MLTPGRIVLYKLNEFDVAAIAERRDRTGIGGNRACLNDIHPAIVVRTWDGKLANLQVLLDGHDTHWATSRAEGQEAGEWHWPARAETRTSDSATSDEGPKPEPIPPLADPESTP